MPTFGLYENVKLTRIVTSVPESQSVRLPQPNEAEKRRMLEFMASFVPRGLLSPEPK